MEQATRRYPPCAKCLRNFKRYAIRAYGAFDPDDYLSKHPQAHIEWKGKSSSQWADSACVDEEVAPLILTLWKLGLRTDGSCQDYNGRITVDSFDASMLFAYYLASEPSFMACLPSVSMVDEERPWSEIDNLALHSQIEFDRKYLPYVVKDLEQALAERGA